MSFLLAQLDFWLFEDVTELEIVLPLDQFDSLICEFMNVTFGGTASWEEHPALDFATSLPYRQDNKAVVARDVV